MIVVDTSIPPSTYPRQDYQVLGRIRRGGTCGPDCWPLANGGCDCDSIALRGLGGADTTTIIGTVVLGIGTVVFASAALFAIHHFIRKPYRRGRVR